MLLCHKRLRPILEATPYRGQRRWFGSSTFQCNYSSLPLRNTSATAGGDCIEVVTMDGREEITRLVRGPFMASENAGYASVLVEWFPILIHLQSAMDSGQCQWYIYPNNHTYGTYLTGVLRPLAGLAFTSTGEDRHRLPLDDLGEELLNEALVIRLELRRVHRIIALAIQVVRVERLHGGKCLLVLGVAEVLVSALAVPAWSTN